MDQSAIRRNLLDDHARLKSMLKDVREAAEHAHESDGMRGELHARIERLHVELRAHNRREEELLKGILLTVDAWGAVRANIMTDEHVAEHVELCAVLTDAKLTSHSAVLDGTLSAALDQVLGHMAREETAFLGEDVLRDDSVIVHQFSG